MEVIFSLIKTNHQKIPLRTSEVRGVLINPPKVGESLVVLSSSLTPEGVFRTVATSPVVNFKLVEEGFEVETKNSLYNIKVLDPLALEKNSINTSASADKSSHREENLLIALYFVTILTLISLVLLSTILL